jgi:4-hydroxybenzoate polyprenyltransferase
MELLNSNFFLATAICVVYFILKVSIEKNKDAKKKVFKDSILVGIVSYAVLIFRSNFVSFESSKTTTIFTNEPQF